ncbi:MAG TPA: FHA domain-containing protein [Ardenticatenaceae bacterium]
MLSCPRCASQQLPNTLFCDDCGEELKSVSMRVGDERRRALYCDFLDSGRSVVFPRRREYILGRGESNGGSGADVDLGVYGGDKAGVSRRHARLIRRGYDIYVEDLNSTNGTFINERRLTPNKPILVKQGEMVHLGMLRVAFRLSSAKAS